MEHGYSKQKKNGTNSDRVGSRERNQTLISPKLHHKNGGSISSPGKKKVSIPKPVNLPSMSRYNSESEVKGGSRGSAGGGSGWGSVQSSPAQESGKSGVNWKKESSSNTPGRVSRPSSLTRSEYPSLEREGAGPGPATTQDPGRAWCDDERSFKDDREVSKTPETTSSLGSHWNQRSRGSRQDFRNFQEFQQEMEIIFPSKMQQERDALRRSQSETRPPSLGQSCVTPATKTDVDPARAAYLAELETVKKKQEEAREARERGANESFHLSSSAMAKEAMSTNPWAENHGDHRKLGGGAPLSSPAKSSAESVQDLFEEFSPRPLTVTKQVLEKSALIDHATSYLFPDEILSEGDSGPSHMESYYPATRNLEDTMARTSLSAIQSQEEEAQEGVSQIYSRNDFDFFDRKGSKFTDDFGADYETPWHTKRRMESQMSMTGNVASMAPPSGYEQAARHLAMGRADDVRHLNPHNNSNDNLSSAQWAPRGQDQYNAFGKVEKRNERMRNGGSQQQRHHSSESKHWSKHWRTNEGSYYDNFSRTGYNSHQEGAPRAVQTAHFAGGVNRNCNDVRHQPGSEFDHTPPNYHSPLSLASDNVVSDGPGSSQRMHHPSEPPPLPAGLVGDMGGYWTKPMQFGVQPSSTNYSHRRESRNW